jgi:ABC-2 type transport system permease protein
MAGRIMEEKNSYSNLRAMKAIAFASFRAILRSPSAVVFSLVFPLIFILVFGFLNGNHISFDVGIDPSGDTTGHDNISVDRESSFESMQQSLSRGRLDAIVKFEKTGNAEVVNVTTSNASKNTALIATTINSMVNEMNLKFYKIALEEEWKISKNNFKYPHAEIRQTEIAGREYKMIDFILPGQLGFSILSAGVFGTAFVFFSLRQTLVLKRFFATPIRRIYIVLGEAASRLVFQLLGSFIIIIIGKYLFDFTLINGVTTLIYMLLLSALGLIIFMGFGFVVSGIAKNESVIPPIANIVTLPQFLLSGTFFSIEAFPHWLQMISNVLPLTYLNNALRKVAFEGAGFFEISHELLILSIWGVIVYIAAAKFFRWE